ncbi:hypothetical protein ABBQ32_004250 [Trebouxia sp. C0010 RCD-2024]
MTTPAFSYPVETNEKRRVDMQEAEEAQPRKRVAVRDTENAELHVQAVSEAPDSSALKEMDIEQLHTLVATYSSADPVPVSPGQWQSDQTIIAGYQAVLQDCLKQANDSGQLTCPLRNVPYAIDSRPISRQHADPAVPKQDKQLMYCNVVAITLATSEYKIQKIGLEDTLAKGLVSSIDFSCPIRYMYYLQKHGENLEMDPPCNRPAC